MSTPSPKCERPGCQLNEDALRHLQTLLDNEKERHAEWKKAAQEGAAMIARLREALALVMKEDVYFSNKQDFKKFLKLTQT